MMAHKEGKKRKKNTKTIALGRKTVSTLKEAKNLVLQVQ